MVDARAADPVAARASSSFPAGRTSAFVRRQETWANMLVSPGPEETLDMGMTAPYRFPLPGISLETAWAPVLTSGPRGILLETVTSLPALKEGHEEGGRNVLFPVPSGVDLGAGGGDPRPRCDPHAELAAAGRP